MDEPGSVAAGGRSKASRTRSLAAAKDAFFEWLDAANIGLAWLDPDGRIIGSNAAFAKVIGQPLDRLAGRLLKDLLAPEEIERVMRPFRRLKAGGPSFTMEVRYQIPNGSRAWAYQSFLPPRDGRPCLAIIHDETYLRRTKKDLRRLNDQIEDRFRDRTAEMENMIQDLQSYNYSVTHDLRTPLRAIRGFTDLLLARAGALDASMQVQVKAVHEAARQMNEIIEGLQSISGMSRVELRRERVDLSKLVRGILDRLAHENPRRIVVTRVKRKLEAWADPNLARVLLENLVSNAWKFSKLEPETRIEFGVVQRDGRDYFFVRDNGIGFENADAAKLFHPFRRLHRDDRFEGTGIGLSTVQQIVRRHGGRVFAEARPGQGATFYFTLSRWESWA